MGLFDKKYCDICGEKTGLPGNRKLRDGNLCRNCAGKLSPWFTERKQSSVEEIRYQLAWKEENRELIRDFEITRTIGETMKLLIDDRHGWFTVCSAADLYKADADILRLDEVTGCDVDIDEKSYEAFRRTAEGKTVSYNPPRYNYEYNFSVIIHVTAPYYDEMRFSINVLPVTIAGTSGTFSNRLIENNHDYRKYHQMAEEMKQALLPASERMQTWNCRKCGKTDNTGRFCENCGAPAV